MSEEQAPPMIENAAQEDANQATSETAPESAENAQRQKTHLSDAKGDVQHSGLRDWVLLQKLWPFMKPHWVGLTLSFVLLPLVTVTQMAQPFIVRQAIDHYLPNATHEGDLSGLMTACGIFLLILLLHYLVRYEQMRIAQDTGQYIIQDIRIALYAHLQSLSLRFFHKNPVGRLMSRVTSDVENLSEMLSAGGLAILQDVAIVAGGIIGMLVMEWKLACVALVMLLVNVIVMEVFRIKTRKAYDDIRIKLPKMTAFLNENILGMELIQLYSRQERNEKEFEVLNESYYQSRLSSVFFSLSFNSVVELLTILTQVIVLYFAGHWILQNEMSFGLLAAFFLLVTMAFEPIESISEKMTILQSGLASIDKVVGLLQQKADILTPSKPHAMPNPLKGEIVFDDVSFGYHPQAPVIRHMKFTASSGKTLALVGPSGAGKTTVIKLLMRFYDIDQGSIRLDGVDIRTLSVPHLRRAMVSIQQDDILFSRSVSENITLTPGKFEDRSHDEQKRIVESVREVNALSMIHRLPEQFNEILQERGKNLSVGERQLLLFARAIYHNPSILILDEATSAVDPKTEGLVQEALERITRGRTVIVIAHRLSTIERADQILFIEQGELMESGTHPELMRQKGRYADFYQYQQFEQKGRPKVGLSLS